MEAENSYQNLRSRSSAAKSDQAHTRNASVFYACISLLTKYMNLKRILCSLHFVWLKWMRRSSVSRAWASLAQGRGCNSQPIVFLLEVCGKLAQNVELRTLNNLNQITKARRADAHPHACKLHVVINSSLTYPIFDVR